MKKRFKFRHQLNEMDCAPTCLHMICTHYGRHVDMEKIRKYTEVGKDGTSLLGLSDAAEAIGLRTLCVKISFLKLLRNAPLPCIIHWDQNHFVVVTSRSNARSIEVADPANGIIRYSRQEFYEHWLQTTQETEGIALLLEPTPEFYQENDTTSKSVNWGFLAKYLFQYRRYFLQLIIGLVIASLLQLIFPFLTQSIVDVGIRARDMQYISIILLAQSLLLFGRFVTDFIRSYLLLHIGTRVNISILSDFWIKLMQLPLSYFDSKRTGDIMQRIGDHSRIQQFLTTGSLNVLFSMINLLIFSFVLLLYNVPVFLVFLVGSLLYFFWIRFFLKYRRKIDFQRFSLASKENTATLQLVLGMQEIRLNNCEKVKRWDWERLQAALFRLSFKGLELTQYQQAGAFFINEGKNIIITFFVAKAVIDGHLTLGAMLAIQYMIGQLNSPVEQLVGFVHQAQDAKLSIERINEVHTLENEETIEAGLLQYLPENKSIQLTNLSFTYSGSGNEPVLRNINLNIPERKLTAIVGMSGSGKTTLLKLLLKFYDHYKGEIRIGGASFRHISHEFWRKQCSSVLQDGYIFNDTIAGNIALRQDQVNQNKLVEACRLANILSFIESMPLGFQTKIGVEGTGISQGQKQRLLIARAVFKNSAYIFFDEATNALDANNETAILSNLQPFLADKTVVVVAHRLSTVRNADKIVVLHEGEIVEEGTHDELAAQKGHYYELVKNQLELGN